MAAQRDDAQAWREAWCDLECRARRATKARGRPPTKKMRDQWDEFDDNIKRAIGPWAADFVAAHTEYETLLENQQHAEPDVTNQAAANAFLNNGQDYINATDHLRSCIGQLIRARHNQADDYSALNYLRNVQEDLPDLAQLQEAYNDFEARANQAKQPDAPSPSQAAQRGAEERSPPEQQQPSQHQQRWQVAQLPQEQGAKKAGRRTMPPGGHTERRLRTQKVKEYFRTGGGWLWAGYLGRGGFGSAEVYVKQNVLGTVVDRVAIKTVLNPPQHLAMYGPDQITPTEITAMYRIRPLKGSENVVKIRNWNRQRRQHPEKQPPYRIYMEFCPHGSLSDLAQKYLDSNKAHPESPRFIPEPFIWAAFESLATAAMLMENGDLEPNAFSNWERVIHRDIKPANIFLGNNSTGVFAGYHTAKLGDFGLCLVLHKQDMRPATDFMYTEEQYRYWAPEHYRIESFGWSPHRLGQGSNVWAIALTIFELMQLDSNHPKWIYSSHANNVFPDPPDFRDDVKDNYSKVLRELVRDCLMYRQEDRPTVGEIRERTRGYTGGELQDYARGLRHASSDDRGYLRHALLGFGREPFVVGTALSQNWTDDIPHPGPPKKDSGNSPEDDDVGRTPGPIDNFYPFPIDTTPSPPPTPPPPPPGHDTGFHRNSLVAVPGLHHQESVPPTAETRPSEKTGYTDIDEGSELDRHDQRRSHTRLENLEEPRSPSRVSRAHRSGVSNARETPPSVRSNDSSRKRHAQDDGNAATGKTRRQMLRGVLHDAGFV